MENNNSENVSELRAKTLAKGRKKCISDSLLEFWDELSPSPLKPLSPTHNSKATPCEDNHVKTYTSTGKGNKALINKIKKKYQEKKEKEKAARKAKKIIKPLQWDQLDLRGHPIISFDAKSKKRKKILEALERKPQSRLRQAIIKKLSSEMGRIYARFRVMLQRSKGNKPTYALSPALQQRYCSEIGIQCLYNGITPRQLLEYWHEHIRDFADGDMKFPPLSFLASPFAAEKVASVLYEHTQGGKDSWHPGDFKRKVESGEVAHSFSDTGQLHKNLRRGLERAGFEVGRYSDRHLMTIQVTARSIAKGHKIFVGENMRGMVMWAVDNIFGGINGQARTDAD